MAQRQKMTILALSGGLDSSILAASLAAAGTPCVGLNMVTHDPLGDERAYARIVADHVGMALETTFENPFVINLWHSDAAELPRPVACAYTQSADRAQQALAARTGATAYMSGGGGDQVFAYMHSCTPLIDSIALRGWTRASWNTARDIAAMTDISLPALLAAALRRALRRDNRYIWRADTRGMSDFAKAAVLRQPPHPWGDPPSDIPPGKVMHVAWLQYIENHLEGYGRQRDRPVLWPLVSQPVVELCIRIPSWQWCAGGRNRSLARKAFSRDLPSSITTRISKGSPESILIATFEQNRNAIVDTLASGILAGLGLVDATALREMGRADRPLSAANYGRIMQWLDVEVWAASWQGRTL